MVRHPNVCAIHEYGQDGLLCFIAMELVEGEDLKQLLQRQGRLPPEEAFAAAIQVAEGLVAIHDVGIIHRDVKTPNIMRDARGIVRLMDFGVAKLLESSITSLTYTGQLVGTPDYMSPEQVRGERLDARCDVYALGVVLFEMLTGEMPFRGDTPVNTLLKHLNDPPPLEHRALAPAAVPVLTRALAKDPADRYATAAAMADALREAALRHAEQKGLPVTLPGTLPRPARRGLRPTLPAVSLGAIALLLSYSFWPAPPAATQPPPPVVTQAAISLAPVTSLPAPAPTPSPRVETARVAEARPPATTLPAPPSSLGGVPAAEPAAPAPSPAGETPSPTSTAPDTMPAAPLPLEAPQAVATPAEADLGIVDVRIRPWAELTVDGRKLGPTSEQRLVLPAGAHALTFVHPDFEPLRRRITLQSAERRVVSIDLKDEAVPRKR